MLTLQRFLYTFVVCLMSAALSLAQDAPPQPLSLSAAVDFATRNYPAIRASRARAAAAGAGVDLARTAYLPRLDLLWQENRATRNNVFGLLLPQSIIPSISGPVLGTSSYVSTWGSAGGTLLSWEPFDFGLRKANVDLGRALERQANAATDVTRLDIATTAADAFLTLLAAQQEVQATQANVERLEVFARSVHVLVANELRPGADASRADAELAAAKTQSIQAQQAAEIGRATLAEALGVLGPSLSLDPGPLLDLPVDSPVAIAKFDAHPLALAQAASVEAAHARKRIWDRSYFPRFSFQSAYYGRGTGARLDGRLGGDEGLLPDVPNWAAGLTVTFPVFDVFAIRDRKRIEANNEAAERAHYDQTVLGLKAGEARARALLDAARRIAENTPVQLNAARETETRARARYEAGLATVVEVAEAQRLLVQAEIDDAVARLAVWRALLGMAKAQGDLRPFLQQVSTTPVSRRK
ncbi:MAG: TolC family protein [Acidobacteria bacterium]|nr:TolC family protein [Acidobacteriota bacterium]